MLNRVSLATALLVALGMATAPARAQLVPRLVDYPVYAPAPACVALSPDSPYAARSNGHTQRYYADRACNEKTLLYTVEGAKLSVTPLGTTMVAKLCDAQLPGIAPACLEQNVAR